MISHTTTGLPRPALPTLAAIQRRRAELLGIRVDHQPGNQQEEEPDQQLEEQIRPAPAAPPPVREDEHEENEKSVAEDEEPARDQ
jgi:hypothetical protein